MIKVLVVDDKQMMRDSVSATLSPRRLPGRGAPATARRRSTR
jgi:chemotaxis response regulator CheB